MNTHDDHLHRHNHSSKQSINSVAFSATLHCLIGCMVGEMIGLTIGTHMGLESHFTITLAVVLSFVSGYAFSTVPLLRKGLPFTKALRLVFAADTLSILAMTFMDNLVMLTIPGAMHTDLTHPIYWISRILAITAAFAVAYPVNRWLLTRGKGHALIHEHHH